MAQSSSSAPSRNSTSSLPVHRGNGLAALARHKADIQRADTAGGRVNDAKTIPLVAERAGIGSDLRRKTKHRRTIGTVTEHPAR